jgi:hypothetical protein
MEIRLNHPEVLADFESAPPCRVRGWTWFALGLWLLLTGCDWAARFGVFRWQDQWIRKRRSETPPSAAVQPAFRSRIVPAQTGAGLTKMVPVPWIAARYSELHPAYVEYQDENGYFNAPLPEGCSHDIVMIGDSFMLSLGTQHLAQVLADISGHGVFNHAMYGAGPFHEIPKFIESDQFAPPTQIVIWNLTARELNASLFLRQPVEAWFAQIHPWAAYMEARARSRIRWNTLAPAVLSKAWPNTSIIAYFCRNGWAQINLVVFHAWPRDVLGADDPQFGPILFYRWNLRVLPLLSPESDAPGVVAMVLKVAKGFQDRGMTLVVMLVPEKEQIHIRALPPADQQALARGPDLLSAIERGLSQEGVPVLNLLPVFQQATAQGQRLYWRDDTHWNDAGIRLAAEELWRVTEPLMK